MSAAVALGGGALALLVLLVGGAALGCLGGEFCSADRRAVSGLDLFAHGVEGRDTARCVTGVQCLGRQRYGWCRLGRDRFGVRFVGHAVTLPRATDYFPAVCTYVADGAAPGRGADGTSGVWMRPVA